MLFDDNDLERLKARLLLNEGPWNLSYDHKEYFGTLDALLARLEAAEACLKYYGHDNISDYEEYGALIKNWRKVAGKD